MEYLVSIHNDTIVQYNKKATNVNRQVSLVFKSNVWGQNMNPSLKTTEGITQSLYSLVCAEISIMPRNLLPH